MHEINSCLGAPRGEKTLVVWPTNTEDLEKILVDVAHRIGADALLGVDDASYRFDGPAKEDYLPIARQTIATLNQGASLADLGGV